MTTNDADAIVQPKRRIALALGSGGARGYAHIGVIETLQGRNYEVACLSGSSMGALVGALYSAGHLPEYVEWVLGLSQFDVVRLLDPSIGSPGAVRADKVFGRVRELLHGERIEDFPLPFTAVTTDLRARKEVWFQSGLAFPAVRASVAIPGFFAPVKIDGRLYVDGGIMDPVPVAPLAAAVVDATIAVDLGGDRTHPDTDGEDAGDVRTFDEWAERFRRGAAQLFDRNMIRGLTNRFGGRDDHHAGGHIDEDDEAVPPVDPDEPFEPLPRDLSKFNVMNQSLEAMQYVLTRYRLAGHRPDVVITVPKDACRTVDFHRAAEMIDLGRKLAGEALDRFEAGTVDAQEQPAP
ncbi:MAG: patatin-like phospholipase family protein [Acidimicrobiia bacterium]